MSNHEYEFERGREAGIKWGERMERERIIKLLVDLNAIRRDALGYWVAVNTDATGTVYLDGLEPK
jgi:hypothetical protein